MKWNMHTDEPSSEENLSPGQEVLSGGVESLDCDSFESEFVEESVSSSENLFL